MSRNRRSAKQAGAKLESAFASYMSRQLDDDRIERRHLSGTNDRGDITGIHLDGQRVVIECKNTTRMDISQHLKEAETEAGNDDALYYFVVQKRRGIGIDTDEGVGRQLVYTTVEQLARILNHGLPLGADNDNDTEEED